MMAGKSVNPIADHEKGWVEVTGYKFRYQVDEEGNVRKQMPDGSWYLLTPYMSGRSRVCVRMRTLENKKVDIPIVWLVADAFLGGRRKGMPIIHRNGCKFDCAARNLQFTTTKECGALSGGNRRRAVFKIDRDGSVVAVYPSVTKAAEENYISHNSIRTRCVGQVKDPYRLDGFDYRYETTRSNAK